MGLDRADPGNVNRLQRPHTDSRTENSTGRSTFGQSSCQAKA